MQAVRLNPNDPHAWHNMANYLDVVGRTRGLFMRGCEESR